MMKKFIIGLCITFGFIFFASSNVNASVVLGGTTLSSNNFKVLGVGNATMIFNDEVVYNDITTYPQYFLLTMCADNDNITSWYINNNTLSNVNVYNTNYKCMFPNSSYTGGHIVYIYGRYNPVTSCNASLSNCVHNGNFTYYVPNQSSWALLSYQNSDKEISIDYASDTLISQNQSIINQNSTIIQQNNNIWDKSNEINNNITNDNVDDPTSSINSFQNMLATNGVITQLVTLPITLFTKVLNSVNGTCSSYNLGSLFGTDLILPCISISNYIGNTLFSVIDVLISGLFVYSISRRFIKVFENLSSMKEGDVIGD